MIQVKAGTIITHCIGWLIFLMLPLLFINGQNENAGILTIILSPYYWIFLVCYAILYYSHTYYVFPEWYSKKNYVVYAIYLVVFLALIFFISPFDKLVGLAGSGGPQPGFRPDHFSWISAFEQAWSSRTRQAPFRHCKHYSVFSYACSQHRNDHLAAIADEQGKNLTGRNKKGPCRTIFP